jgi:hypothetical protein
VKIIQTFWTGNTSVVNPLSLTGGWLSAEYHWMAWALSCLQFRNFYENVELVTDTMGKTILIDLLQLPYTTVRVELDVLNQYSPKLWALAKIYSYSLQQEPFIHADGDVFIWQPFPATCIDADLIAQNFEIDFPFYHDPLRTVQREFQKIPACMVKELERSKTIYSCNTGVIGGKKLAVFQEYSRLAFDFVDANIDRLNKVDMNHFNICFEQFLYYTLAKSSNIELIYLIANKGDFDPTYPGFANFHKVPYQTHFIHAMAEYKRNPEVCQHLARRLRQDFPEIYYRILRICQESGLALHHMAYSVPELSPTRHTSADYNALKQTFLSGNLSVTKHPNWLYQYAKDIVVYEQVEQLFSLPDDQLLAQQLQFDADCQIIETHNPQIQQTLRIFDIQTLSTKEFILDSLNIVLVDAFLDKKSVQQGILDCSIYFNPVEIQRDGSVFQQLVLDRLKELMFLGALKWCG